MNNQITKKDFHFCYDKKLMIFLKKKGINYICEGIAESTKKKFFLYFINDELNKYINEYKNNSK